MGTQEELVTRANMLFLIFAFCVVCFMLGTKITVDNYDVQKGYRQPAYDIGYGIVLGSLFIGVEALFKIVSDPEKVMELFGYD